MLPVMLGIMAVGELINLGVGLYQQHKMSEQNDKALEMYQQQQQQQQQQMAQFLGHGIPGASYPQMPGMQQGGNVNADMMAEMQMQMQMGGIQMPGMQMQMPGMMPGMQMPGMA